jgi:glutaredoxin-like protein NrdH
MSVTVYGKPRCPQCSASERKLVKDGIAHTKIDVSQDAEAFEYVKTLGYNQVPVTVNDETGEHWYGFQPDKLDALKEPLEALAEAS